MFCVILQHIYSVVPEILYRTVYFLLQVKLKLIIKSSLNCYTLQLQHALNFKNKIMYFRDFIE